MFRTLFRVQRVAGVCHLLGAVLGVWFAVGNVCVAAARAFGVAAASERRPAPWVPAAPQGFLYTVQTCLLVFRGGGIRQEAAVDLGIIPAYQSNVVGAAIAMLLVNVYLAMLLKMEPYANQLDNFLQFV
jgi:hypothetical protein